MKNISKMNYIYKTFVCIGFFVFTMFLGFSITNVHNYHNVGYQEGLFGEITTDGYCETGSYLSSMTGSGTPICYTCPAGSYCPASSDSKVSCEEGTYQDETGQSSCKTCSSDKYCPVGATHEWTMVNKPTAANCVSGLVYNVEEQTLSNASSGYTLTDNKATNAGSYTVIAYLASGYVWKDKTFGSATYECSIAKATPTVTVGNTSKVYDGKALVPSATVKVNGKVVTVPTQTEWYDGSSCSTTRSGAPTEVGKYSVKVYATVTNNTNPTGTPSNLGSVPCTAIEIKSADPDNKLSLSCTTPVKLGASGSCTVKYDNTAVDNSKVTWGSAAIGLGFKSGSYTPVAIGEFQVSATYNDVTEYATVNVVSAASLDLICSSSLIAKGGTTTCITKFNGNSVSAKYTSTDTSVATVGETDGKVTGVKAGTTTIKSTYTYNNTEYTDTYAITVSKGLKSLEVEPKTATIKIGESVKITKATVTYDDNTTANVLNQIQTIGTTNITSPAQATFYGYKLTAAEGENVTVKYVVGNESVYANVKITVSDKYYVTLDNKVVSLAKSPDTLTISGKVSYVSGATVNDSNLKLKFSNDLSFVDGTINYKSDGTFTATFAAKTTENQGTTSICIEGSEICSANITVKVHCKAWTVVNSQKEWKIGNDLGHAHVTLDEYNYVDYSNDCTLKSGTTDTYVCTKYYNRSCGSGGNSGGGNTPTYACYRDSQGNHSWATSAPNGYSIVGGISSESNCKGCYKNEQNDYKWAITVPDGYTYVSGITSESSCTNGETYACYKNSQDDYKWATQAPDGYTLVGGVTSEADCKKTESPACYKNNSNGIYIWGLYANDSNYTLMHDIDNEADCDSTYDVPITASDTASIIYVSVIVMIIVGSAILYIYRKEYLN